MYKYVLSFPFFAIALVDHLNLDSEARSRFEIDIRKFSDGNRLLKFDSEAHARFDIDKSQII
jgi:hypothetical protein